MAKPTYFTICSKNYLAYALTLGRSLRAADPAARLVIFLADSPLAPEDAPSIEFETIAAEELDLPNFADMALSYSIMEFNTAIKPACFEYLFDHMGASSAVYLDPDIYVLKPLEHVEAAIADGAALVLTPHSLSPLDDGGDPDDLRLLRSGTFNLGFAAYRNEPDARDFLRWWKNRLSFDCRVALDEGIFVDQKWMDLAPSYIGSAKILRHPGYNAAYWNLLGRPITLVEGEWLASEKPLYFYHFSGVAPGDGSVFSKHQNRFAVDDIGDLRELLYKYLQQLDLNGHTRWRREPYAYALPRDMNGCDAFVRAAFRRVSSAEQRVADVDKSRLEAICNNRSVRVAQGADPIITNFTYEVWAQREDLRRLFDLSRRDDRARFNLWLMASGVEEHKIPSRLLSHICLPSSGSQVAEGKLPLKARIVHEGLKRRRLFAPVVRCLPKAWQAALKRKFQSLMSDEQEHNIDNLVSDGTEVPRIEIPIAVYGYFNAETGLGQAVRREFRALRSAGIPAVARSFQAEQFKNQEVFEFDYDAGLDVAQIHLIHVNADQVVVADTWADPDVFASRHYRIGFWAWELERFPSNWRAALDKVDEIWTPSRFVANSIKAVTEKPVYTFAHPVPIESLSKVDREVRQSFALPQRVPIFLSIFDFNSFTERKNPEGVLEAFERAREKVRDLRLVLKCHGGARFDSVRAKLFERARSVEGVHIIDRVLNRDEMRRLFAACDGLISLHRSEGFGLTIAEAMAHGKAVIATDYSGSTDYFDAAVGIPVRYDVVPVASGAYPYGDGASWAEPDVLDAEAALVRFALDGKLRDRLGLAAQARIAERLSIDRVGRLMSERIDEIRRTLAKNKIS